MTEALIVAGVLSVAGVATPLLVDWSSPLMAGCYLGLLGLAVLLVAWVTHVLVRVIALCGDVPDARGGAQNV